MNKPVKVNKSVVVYTDASVDAEKGVAGLAILCLVQAKGGGKFFASLSLPVSDSTLAEVMAIKVALEMVLMMLGPRTPVTLFCDNESVVEHLRTGKRNGRQDLNRALESVFRLKDLLQVTFRHRPRCDTPEMKWVDEDAFLALESARNGTRIARKSSLLNPEASQKEKKEGFTGLLRGIFRRLLHQ